MPSTIDSPRSTSPPKSAWPGVSMMLIVMPPADRVGRARAGVVDRGVLREDRDPLLALEVAGVHDPLGDPGLLLVRGERAGLVEHRVDERGLAVVDVRDDRDVPEVRTGGRHGGTTSLSQDGIRGPILSATVVPTCIVKWGSCA